MENRVPYITPEITDYGSLVKLTADVEHLNLSAGVLRAVAGAAVISQPMVPGAMADGGGVLSVQDTGSGSLPGSSGGGGGALGDPGGGSLPGGGGADPGGTAGDAGTGSGTGGGAGAGGGQAAGSRLPFTGFSVFAVAVVGAGMAAAGASLRARLNRAR